MKKTLLLIPFLAILVFPVFAHADTVTFPDGCTATTKYSATTGQPCQKGACSPGDVYSSETGQKCSDINTNLPQGCITLVGYSPLTGHKCDGTDLNIQTVSQANQGIPTVGQQSVTPPQSQAHVTVMMSKVSDGMGQFNYPTKIYIYDQDGNNYNGKSTVGDVGSIHQSSNPCGCQIGLYSRAGANFVPDSNGKYYISASLVDTQYGSSFNSDGTFTVEIPRFNILQTFNKNDLVSS